MDYTDATITRIYGSIAAYTTSSHLIRLAVLKERQEYAMRENDSVAQVEAIDALNAELRMMLNEIPEVTKLGLIGSLTKDMEGI